MPRGGQPGDLRVVGLTTGLLLVAEAREQRVVVPVLVDEREVVRRFVTRACGLREPVVRVET